MNNEWACPLCFKGAVELGEVLNGFGLIFF